MNKYKIKIVIILALICAGFFYAQNIKMVRAEGKININIAGLEELDFLPGIGPSKAQAIIDYRNTTNGPFQKIEDIMNVSGIKQATFDGFKDLITVGGEDELPVDEEFGNKPQDPIAPLQDDSFKLGDIVINEFVSDPADGEVEWIELYNNTKEKIDLTGWTIEEGSGAKTVLSGEILKFFVIEKPKGNLNNAGDIIILKDAEENIIDQVVYGNWDDGSLENNAPVADDPNSTARKIDGEDSGNNANDFAITSSLTKGESNIINESEIINNESRNVAGIIISEILPDPIGVDAGGEFIEIYNNGDEDIDLTGWRLENEIGMRYEFGADNKNSRLLFHGSREASVLKAGKYLAIYRSESGIILNNTGGSIKLFKPGGSKVAQTVKFKNALEEQSYNYNGDKWLWSDIPTPGAENILPEINNLPTVKLYCPKEAVVGTPVGFDASDSFDKDGDELDFSWDFGDGFKNNLQNPAHTFMKEGNYEVVLTVNDGKDEITTSKKIIIRGNRALPRSDGAPPRSGKSKIVINEILPSPEGADEDGEWVELKNEGETEVSLLDWTLDDMEGGSAPYKFIRDIWLGAGAYYLAERTETKIALNNTGDFVRLFNDLEELMDEGEYGMAPVGEAYARGTDGKWFWTNILTPGKENIFSAEENYNTPVKNGNYYSVSSDAMLVPTISAISDVKNLNPGDFVLTNGVVAVLPGILGAQYFYIVEDGGAGIQVYSYKKNFPDLKIGDYVEVTGELSQVSGETRIKISQKENIIILKHAEEPIPEEISCAEINEGMAGSLVKIAGEIVERKGSVIYLDDGEGEAKVYLKSTAGLSPKNYKEGETVEVAGIVGLTLTGPRIMPRGVFDIVKKAKAADTEREVEVLGASSENDEWAVGARDKKVELFKYLLIIAGAAIILLAGLLTKAMIKGKK